MGRKLFLDGRAEEFLTSENEGEEEAELEELEGLEEPESFMGVCLSPWFMTRGTKWLG